LERPELLEDQNHIKQSEYIFQRGTQVIQKYKGKEDYYKLMKDAKTILSRLKNDQASVALLKDIRDISRDMLLDQTGKPSFEVMRQSLAEIRSLIVPILLEHLREVPIPMIEGETSDMRYAFDNIVLYGYDLLPEKINVFMDTNIDVEPFDLSSSDKTSFRLHVHIRDFKMHLRNLMFNVDKFKMPTFRDQGALNIDLWGEDSQIALIWKVKMVNGYPVFYDARGSLILDKLKLRAVQAKKKALMNLAFMLFGGTIKRRIEAQASDKLTFMLNGLNAKLNELFNKTTRLIERGVRGRTMLRESTGYYPGEWSPGMSKRKIHISPSKKRAVSVSPVVVRHHKKQHRPPAARHPDFSRGRSLSPVPVERYRTVERVVPVIERERIYDERARYGPSYEPHAVLHPGSIKSKYPY